MYICIPNITALFIENAGLAACPLYHRRPNSFDHLVTNFLVCCRDEMEVTRVQQIHVLFMLLVGTGRCQVNPGMAGVLFNASAVCPRQTQ